MSEKKTYTGGCHCKKVRYQVTTDLAMVLQCNCSICTKRGATLTFVPRDQLEVLSGEDAQTDYQFNKKNIHHLFCSTCGVASYAHGTGPDGKPMAAINLCCLDDFDMTSVTPKQFDGASL